MAKKLHNFEFQMDPTENIPDAKTCFLWNEVFFVSETLKNFDMKFTNFKPHRHLKRFKNTFLASETYFWTPTWPKFFWWTEQRILAYAWHESWKVALNPDSEWFWQKLKGKVSENSFWPK